MRFAQVDAGAIAEVVWVSLVAGIGVTLTFSILVLGGLRSAAARREGRETAVVAYAVVAVMALAVFLAGVVFGVQIMLSKD